MNQERLPNNIKSIISSIDLELKENKINIYKETNKFLDSIAALIEYYFSTLYQRIFGQEPLDIVVDKFQNEIDDFIFNLTTAVYSYLQHLKTQKDDTQELYEEILEQVTIKIIYIYWTLLIEWYDNRQEQTIYLKANATSEPYLHDITNLINTAIEFKNNISILPPLEISVLIIKEFSDISVPIGTQSIQCKHLPMILLNDLNKILYLINQYENLFTIKTLYFVNDIYFDEKDDIAYINYQSSIKDIMYHVIYALIDDKIKTIYDEEYWNNIYNEFYVNKYLADECHIINKYLYHPQAELSAFEYCMSCFIAYIMDNDQLQNFDKEIYDYIKILLQGLNT